MMFALETLLTAGGAVVGGNPGYPLIILNNGQWREVSPVLACILLNTYLIKLLIKNSAV